MLLDNVAQRGIAAQSANPLSAATAAYNAIDAYLQPASFTQTCASVQLQDNPWWKLDLRSIYHITAVSVTSIGDCCPEQLSGAEVRIGLRNDTNNQRCAVISVSPGETKYSYQCDIMAARFVHIVLPGLQKTLTVCEVEVYGTVLDNVALRGVAFQSSFGSNTAGKASSVIDGSRVLTCSQTADKPGQWVTVELLVPHNVTVILLTFNVGCCYGEEVRVDDTRCEMISSGSQSLVTYHCGGIVGRYVTVIHPDIPQTLCEVEIYSTWEEPNNTFPQLPQPQPQYFFLIQTAPRTWYDAQTYCKNQSAALATIRNAENMNSVINKMDQSITEFWIGLYEDVLTWTWSLSDMGYSGGAEAGFRNWGDGQPTNKSGIQHCAGIGVTGYWEDLDCGLLNYFFCYDGRIGAPATKILVETPMTWADAQRYCRDSYTDLLSVRKQSENQEVQSMVPAGHLVWIGLFLDTWKWSDQNNSTFRYWGQGQPELGEGPNCVYVNRTTWSTSQSDWASE
ncbi:uncharacterized protein LOC113125171 [Mastacembelus armatus]|uniref:uncharacterized protein LOC113125171 n=1 Tax=Mastacembelus armatus TaxID=205130 RepID=UPI000E455588|nr:uncharacterized protein LOC113125171 [Mastacembelus armatus]